MPKINWTLDNLDEILSSLASEQSAQVKTLFYEVSRASPSVLWRQDANCAQSGGFWF